MADTRQENWWIGSLLLLAAIAISMTAELVVKEQTIRSLRQQLSQETVVHVRYAGQKSFDLSFACKPGIGEMWIDKEGNPLTVTTVPTPHLPPNASGKCEVVVEKEPSGGSTLQSISQPCEVKR